MTMIGGERRQHPRVTVTHRVTVNADGRAAAARARNLSEGGLLVSVGQARPGRAVPSTSRCGRAAASPWACAARWSASSSAAGRGRVLYDLGLRFLAEPDGPPLPLLRRLISDV